MVLLPRNVFHLSPLMDVTAAHRSRMIFLLPKVLEVDFTIVTIRKTIFCLFQNFRPVNQQPFNGDTPHKTPENHGFFQLFNKVARH